MVITKRQRIKLRSRKYNDMKPHVFDKLLELLPHVMKGIKIPDHCEIYYLRKNRMTLERLEELRKKSPIQL